jgi:hypothetical protein
MQAPRLCKSVSVAKSATAVSRWRSVVCAACLYGFGATPSVLGQPSAPATSESVNERLQAAQRAIADLRNQTARQNSLDFARLVVDAAVRDSLKIVEARDLTKSDYARVTELMLGGLLGVNDDALRIVADEETGFENLRALSIFVSSTTAAGIQALTTTSSMAKLEELTIYGSPEEIETSVAVLASPNARLPMLRAIHLWGGSDVAVALITSGDSSLVDLGELGLWGKEVTDLSLMKLSSPDSSLQRLKRLVVGSDTSISDAGVKSLVRPDTSLKYLTELSLHAKSMTDLSARYLSSNDSGLKALTALHISGEVTDAGAAALASESSGLRQLTDLSLGGSNISDAGVAHLSSRGSGLGQLRRLNLSNTRVGDAGIATIFHAETGLSRLEVLGLSATEVTDITADRVASAGHLLPNLKRLDLMGTSVSEKAASTIQTRLPSLQVIR